MSLNAKELLLGLVALALAGCASNARLMDAQVRPADRSDCALRSSALNRAPGGSASVQDSRCSAPDDGHDGLYWSSSSGGGEAMKADFSGRHDK